MWSLGVPNQCGCLKWREKNEMCNTCWRLSFTLLMVIQRITFGTSKLEGCVHVCYWTNTKYHLILNQVTEKVGMPHNSFFFFQDTVAPMRVWSEDCQKLECRLFFPSFSNKIPWRSLSICILLRIRTELSFEDFFFGTSCQIESTTYSLQRADNHVKCEYLRVAKCIISHIWSHAKIHACSYSVAVLKARINHNIWMKLQEL